MSLSYRKILLEKIKQFINSNQNLDVFYEDYYLFFVNKVPDKALNEDEFLFFGMIQEKIDFTSENPGKEDRKYGYIDVKEYKIWLRKLLGKLEEFNYDFKLLMSWYNINRF